MISVYIGYEFHFSSRNIVITFYIKFINSITYNISSIIFPKLVHSPLYFTPTINIVSL